MEANPGRDGNRTRSLPKVVMSFQQMVLMLMQRKRRE